MPDVPRVRCGAMAATFTVLDHPLAGDLLTRLRDRDTGPAEYPRAHAPARPAARGRGDPRPRRPRPGRVDTPLEPFEGSAVTKTVVAIPVLRAGLGLLEAVTDLYPGRGGRATSAWSATKRRTSPGTTTRSSPTSRVARRSCVDPMLATGGSGSAAVGYVKAAGADDITFVCVVAAPEGRARVHADHPDVPIVAAALDRRAERRTRTSCPGSATSATASTAPTSPSQTTSPLTPS